MLLDDKEADDRDAFDASHAAFAPAKDLVQSTVHSFSVPAPVLHVDKDMIVDEARRISYSYNEENQKHDLMMKIQETRQRQALQRKLLERKMNQQTMAPASSTGGAGYSSNMSLKDITGKGFPQPSDDLIGPKGAKMLKSPSNLQPAFKNVDADTIVRNDVNKQKSMQSRGLGLAPMLRK